MAWTPISWMHEGSRTMRRYRFENGRLIRRDDTRFSSGTEPNTTQLLTTDLEDIKQRYQKVQKENKALEVELKQVTRFCEDLKSKLIASEDARQDLQTTVDESAGAARDAKRAQICIEEKFRRQSEILEKTTKDLNIALQESRKLTFQQLKLQIWTEKSDDDEISQAMSNLCQQLETWAKHHFPRCPPNGHESYWLCANISYRLVGSWLSRVLVGITGDDYDAEVLNQAIYSLGQEIQETCPPHVNQHWRSAISKAAFSINADCFQTSCDCLVAYLEFEWGSLSPTDPQKRSSELKSLLWDFVLFKTKLECQADSYAFVLMPPDNPFNEEEMISFTGESGPDILVEYTIFPALIKTSANGGQTFTFKARVKTTQAYQQMNQHQADDHATHA